MQVLWLRFRSILCLAFLIGLLCGCASAEPVAELSGKYEIYKIEKIGGGITSTEAANGWKGSNVCIKGDLFSIRNQRLEHPWYARDVVELPKNEGEITPNDLSIFFGIEKNRKSIERLLVFESKSEKYPFEKIEILDRNTLLDLYDGWIYFFKRVAPTC